MSCTATSSARIKEWAWKGLKEKGDNNGNYIHVIVENRVDQSYLNNVTVIIPKLALLKIVWEEV